MLEFGGDDFGILNYTLFEDVHMLDYEISLAYLPCYFCSAGSARHIIERIMTGLLLLHCGINAFQRK